MRLEKVFRQSLIFTVLGLIVFTTATFGQDIFSLSTNQLDISRMKGNETDPSVAFNPTSPTNMVVAAAIDGTVPGLFLAFSTNQGKSWQTNVIATNDDASGLIPAYGDPSVAWDSFGNLFLAYLPITYSGVAVAMSTNGGRSFSMVTNLAPLDSTDQPRITAPYAGTVAGSVWVIYKDYTAGNTPLQVQGAIATGLGSNGIFGPVQMLPNSSAGGFADISVGPKGQVMVAFQDNLHGLPDPFAYPMANVWVTTAMSAATNGILSETEFGAAEVVATNAIGGVTYISPAPSGIGVNAAVGLAWDYDLFSAYYGDAYLIYTSISTNETAVISLLASGDGGTNWNGGTYVDDDALTGINDHFLPRVAVDPLTGIIGCSWYDCRNDLGSDSQAITNEFTESFTISGYMVTNIIFTNIATPVSETWVDTTGQGTNIEITIDANGLSGVLMKFSKDNIYIYGPSATNFIIYAAGTNTSGNATITVTLTNVFPEGFTSGSGGDQEAVMYTTLSFDGGESFLQNQPLLPLDEIINAPAVGDASDVAGSDSLTGWGHYSGLTAYGGNFFPVWADNSDVTTNNPDGANNNFDLLTFGTEAGQNSISVPTADLAVTVTNSPNPVISDGVMIYTVTAINHGPKNAGPVFLTDILSPYVTLEDVVPALGGSYLLETATNGLEEVVFLFPSLLAGQSLTSTIRVTATSSSIDTNIAIIVSPLIDLVPTNNAYGLITVVEGQDLAMSMTSSETNVLVGDTVVSSVTVTNLGPSTNGPVFITNQFSSDWTDITVAAQGTNLVTNTPTGPEVIINLGLLPVGQPVTATFTALAIGVSPFAWESATVGSEDVDTNLSNNSATNDYVVLGEDLGISLSASPLGAQVGQTITFTEEITDFGPSTNGTVMVTNFLSDNLTSFTVLPPMTNYFINQNELVFNLGALYEGQVVSVSFTAVPTTAGNSSDIALVGSQNFDTNQANNIAEATIPTGPALPMISNLVVTPLITSAFITWDTGFPGTAQVEYGLDENYGSISSLNATPGTHHVVLLTGLTQGTNYSFTALSTVGSRLYTTNGSFTVTNDAIILNTQDAIYSGLWTKGTATPGIYGSYYQYSTTTVSSPTASAVYQPFLPTAGLYDVYIWYPQNGNFTANAQLSIHAGTNALFASVNESVNGGSWQPLATNLYFGAGTNGSVTLRNNTGSTNNVLVANAMKWVYVAAQDNPANGSVPAWWANFYFGTNVNGSVNGASDPDGNGYSLYDDYVLGTDPTNAASVVDFTMNSAGSNTLVVTFSPCLGGRTYELQAANDLLNPVWATLTNGCTINENGAGTFTITQGNASASFYRLSARISP